MVMGLVSKAVGAAKKAGAQRVQEKKQYVKEKKAELNKYLGKEDTGGGTDQSKPSVGNATKHTANAPVAPDVGITGVQDDQPKAQPLKGPEKKVDVLSMPENIKSTPEVPGEFDVTLNSLTNMPPGTTFEGASVPKRQAGLDQLSGGVAAPYRGERTMIDDPANIEATLAAGQQAVANRTTPVEDPNLQKQSTDKYISPLPDVAPEDTTIGPTGQTAPGYTGGGRVDALGRSGVTGGPAVPPPGFEPVPSGEEQPGGPQTMVAESERRMQFDDGTPIEAPPVAELDATGRVKRPAFWKLALDAVFGNMPLIPGSRLASIPLARAREDYYKQDKRDQELTDTFLKEMGEGDWDRAKQLARTNVFRDAVTRTMNMTPDDLINLDQQIQANSTESLQNLMKTSKTKLLEIAQKAGGRFQGYDAEGVPILAAAEAPIKTFNGIAMKWDDASQDWIVAHDKEKQKETRRVQQYIDAGYSQKEATTMMLTEGTGVPRFKGIRVGDTGFAMYDQITGDTKEYRFSDVQKANMAMEIFKNEFGVPIGYVMYDKNKGAPEDLSKTTPIFFKDMPWGDQTNGKYTWYDALQGRVRAAVEQKKPFSVMGWISKYFGGIDVTDQNDALPMGGRVDEASDYKMDGTLSPTAQQSAPAPVLEAPPVPQKQKAPPDQQAKAKNFLDSATKGTGTTQRKGYDYAT